MSLPLDLPTMPLTSNILDALGAVLRSDLPYTFIRPSGDATGAIDTAAFQSAFTNSGIVALKSGATYYVNDTVVVPADCTIQGNNAIINAVFGVNYSKALFSNNKTNDQSTVLKGGDFEVRGNCVVFDMRFTANGPGAGLKLQVQRVKYNTYDGQIRDGTSFVVADQIDFASINDCAATNCDVAIQIGSATPRRNCTQIYISNISLLQCRTGGIFQGIDKSRISGVDLMKCNCGYVFAGQNQRMILENVHVEGIGYEGAIYSTASTRASAISANAAGTGFCFPDNAQNSPFKLVHCDTIDIGGAGTVAVAAVYIGDCSNGTIENLVFENCNFPAVMGAAAGYKPLINKGKFKWEGRWPYTTEPTMSANGLHFIDTIINDDVLQVGNSDNILSGQSVLSLISAISGTTAPTITEVTDSVNGPNGWRVDFQSIYELAELVNLPYGWNTIDVTGYRVSGGPILYVSNSSTFVDLVRVQFNGTVNENKRWRISFFNPNAGGVSYKVGFTNQSATPNTDRFFMTEMALYRGFARPTIPRKAIETMAALPAISSRWRNKQVRIRATGFPDTIYDGQKNAAGADVWRKLTPSIATVPAGQALTASDTETTFVNTGATAISVFTLPLPVAGYEYSFIAQDADGVRVTATAAATIRDGASVSATGGKVESTTVGSAITLKAISTTEWMVVSKNGTWTVT